MKKKTLVSLGSLGFSALWPTLGLILIMQGCSSPTSSTTTATTLTCTATASIVAGSPTVPNLPIEIGSLTVSIGNDTTGPFSIAIAGLANVISTPTWDFIDPQIETIIAGTAATALPVTVTDAATGAVGYCTLSLGGTGTGDISVTPSPATAPVGLYSGITLTATSASTPGGTFTFQPINPSEPIQITPISGTQAYVASNTAGTYAIIVTLNGPGTSTQINVTFTGGATTGTVTGSTTGIVVTTGGTTTGYSGQIVINDPQGLSAPAGQGLTFYASDPGLSNAQFTFSVAQSKGWVGMSETSNGGVIITSYVADTPIIEVSDGYNYTTFQLSFY